MSAGQWPGGKGSTFRQVDQKKFDENWELIFGKKDQQKPEEKDLKFMTAEEYMKGLSDEVSD